MSGRELVEKLKQRVAASGWLADTELTFEDVFLCDSPFAVPFGLLLSKDDALLQIRRKFYYPLEVVADALSAAAVEMGMPQQEARFSPVIDADFEWATHALLMCGDRVVTSIVERASDFWFEDEVSMADYLADVYAEGVARLRAIVGS